MTRDARAPAESSGDRTAAVGVLALQGAVAPHLDALGALGIDAVEVRKPASLETVDRLIVPGGESTTLWRLLCHAQLWEPIAARAAAGDLALFGTCAGAILLGRENRDEPPPRWSLVDVTVDRNAYGRQVDSFIGAIQFEAAIDCEDAGGIERGEGSPSSDASEGSDGVFIRAPRFRDPGPEIHVIATCDGEPVAVRQGRILLATFHPELTSDRRLHRLFLSL